MHHSINIYQKEIITWDIFNWARALNYLDTEKSKQFKNSRVLEIGADNGGLSFWAAVNGAFVVCSDLNGPSAIARENAQRFKLKNIEFQELNALGLPYTNEFDFVLFKSVLGGIVRSNDLLKLKRIMSEIHKVLKPGGECLFIENMDGFLLHSYMRRRYGAAKNFWYYPSLKDFFILSKPFKSMKYQTFGFLGGGDFFLKNFRSKLDYYFEKIIPPTWHYIYAGIYKK